MKKVYSERDLPHVMIVDDSLFDIKLLKLAFKKATNSLNISAFTSGQEALAKFFDKDKTSPFKADVCFLDLNMPGMSGLDVLLKMKSSETTKHIPVFVLSTSDLESGISASYKAGANGYLVKPNKKTDLENMAKALLALWTGPHRFLS